MKSARTARRGCRRLAGLDAERAEDAGESNRRDRRGAEVRGGWHAWPAAFGRLQESSGGVITSARCILKALVIAPPLDSCRAKRGPRVTASVFCLLYVRERCRFLQCSAPLLRDSLVNPDGTPAAPYRACPRQLPTRLNQITSAIIEVAIDIHRTLGPGLLESAYLTCLTRDLADARVRIEPQKAVPLIYKDVRIECAYRADLVVEESGGNERAGSRRSRLKSQGSSPRGSYPVGLLLNFNATTMKAGIKRIVNRFPDK